MGPYPPITRWRIPAAALQATLEGVRPAGRRGRESGALWLGRRAETSVVTTVVLPRGKGVVEAPYQWQITPEVMSAITRWARPDGLVMLGMLHVHLGGSVAMSWSDRNRVVQVPGILSVIAGEPGGEADPARWGWYLYHGDAYRELSPSERERRILVDDDGTCTAWVASGDGVQELSVR